MAYATYEQVAALYPEIDEADYNRLSFLADREIDRLTTGVDGVRKLAVAFPTDDFGTAAVVRCEAEIINLMAQIEAAEAAANAAASYTQRADGSYVAGAVASVSSGSESISYASASAAPKTAATVAVSDMAAREKLYADKVRLYLSGVADANGVNLLYGGAYPVCIRTQ